MGILQGLVLRLQSPQEPTLETETETMVADQKEAETAETMAVDPKVAAETEPITMDQDSATVVDPAKAAEPKAVDLLNGSELFLEFNPSSEAEDNHSLVGPVALLLEVVYQIYSSQNFNSSCHIKKEDQDSVTFVRDIFRVVVLFFFVYCNLVTYPRWIWDISRCRFVLVM